MTVSVQTPRVAHITDNVEVDFAFTFRALTGDDIDIFLNDNSTPEDVSTYTVVLVNLGVDGGTVTMNVAPAVGTLTIVRSTPLSQETDYVAFDAFPAETHETALDKAMMALQELEEQVLSIGIPPPGSDPGLSIIHTLPTRILPTDQATDVTSFIVNRMNVGQTLPLIQWREEDNTELGRIAADGSIIVKDGIGSGAIASVNANRIVIDADDFQGMSLLTPDDKSSEIYFGSPSKIQGAQLNWQHTGATPGDKLFTVGTTLTGASMRFMSGGNIEAVRISADQDVAIGIPGPFARLHVRDDVSTRLVRFESISSGSTGVVIEMMHRHPTPLSGGTIVIQNFQGLDSDNNVTTYAEIRAVSKTVTADAEEGVLDFFTTAVGEQTTRAIRIDSNQFVHIGGANPSHKLTVEGDVNVRGGGQYLVDGVPIPLAGIPTGSVVAWPTETPPSGWLICTGQAVDRTTFADLFAILSVNYGVGNGTTTFNVPDYRGEFLRGKNSGSGNDPDAAGRTDRGDGQGGDFVGTRQAGDISAHTHGIGGEVAAASVGGTVQGAGPSGIVISTSTGGNETRPVNVYVDWIIKT